MGNIKKEITYLGDVLNTASRLESVCSQFDKSIVLSADVAAHIKDRSEYSVESIGKILLRGKGSETEIFTAIPVLDSEKRI